jgi:hypothetical protein
MKVLSICLLVIIIFSAIGLSQERIDVIYLKNGDVRKGTIIENVPGDYVKIETAGGSIFTIKYAEIEKFTKEGKQQTQSSSAEVPDAQKMMIYESGKKNPTMGVILSCLLTSAGHAYADNWGRGLLFTAGRVASAVLAVTLGIQTKTETTGGYYYSYTEETVEITPVYYIGLGLTVVLAIWEMIDASAEVDKYNKRLYDKIMGTKSEFGMNIVPTKNGANLVFTYQF